LTVVFRAELFGAGVGNALERAAVFVVSALGILGAAREADLLGARAARPRDALLGLGAGRVEAGQETLAIDTDAGVAAFEIELATKAGRLRTLVERSDAETAVDTGGPKRTFVRVRARVA